VNVVVGLRLEQAVRIREVNRSPWQAAKAGRERGRAQRLGADDKGFSPSAGGHKVAWFKDPGGNTSAVEGDS
jgi:hypothetical protein